MKIHFDSIRFAKRIGNISKTLNTKCQDDCDEYYTVINNQYGKGKISGINFQDGLGLFMVNFTPNEAIELEFDLGSRHPLQFIGCLEGNVDGFSGEDSGNFHLKAMQGIITTTSGADTFSLKIGAGQTVKFASLEIIRWIFLEKVECDLDTIPKELSALFRDTAGTKNFQFVSAISIAISECLHYILENNHQSLVKKAFLESKALELFSYMICQYRDRDEQGNNILMRKPDLRQVEEARDFLLQDLVNTPTINELAHKVGMNENKLQKGFKALYGSTINKYLRNERLKKAKVLLAENKYSISEVAEKVGYKNKGHFSKRFREKFGMLPKDFYKTIGIQGTN